MRVDILLEVNLHIKTLCSLVFKSWILVLNFGSKKIFSVLEITHSQSFLIDRARYSPSLNNGF